MHHVDGNLQGRMIRRAYFRAAPAAAALRTTMRNIEEDYV
jgi:hypothetical protein